MIKTRLDPQEFLVDILYLKPTFIWSHDEKKLNYLMEELMSTRNATYE